jgi:energy-coupling factor transporter ATP-binding protein EcfA2
MKSELKDLRKIINHIPLKKVSIEEGENINRIYVHKGAKGIVRVLETAKDFEELTETERTPLPVAIDSDIREDSKSESETEPNTEFLDEKGKLKTIYEGKLLMRGEHNDYYVMGYLSQDLSSLRITLIVEERTTGQKERIKIDLYEREAVGYFTEQIAETFSQNPNAVEAELLLLTDQLEQYREQQLDQYKSNYQQKKRYQLLSPENQKRSINFLSQSDLIQNIDKLIEEAGVVGEENTRKLLFVIASTYKMSYPLHTLVQGTSGSGKSHLINTIGQCFPPEDVLSMTRVTSKSFYHYSKEELVDKLLLIQDFDGLDEEAQYAFRELQSAGTVSSSTTFKDRNGNITSAVKTVKSHFASMLATTKAEIYYDNMSRSVIIGVDESEGQTLRIIEHQNKKLVGTIDISDERKAKTFLQNCIRCIKPYDVINPYADKVRLPVEAKMLRRLNNHYQSFVKQITILHQYQRKKDNKGRLITEPDDLKIACDILFDAIMLKVDDLDSSLRYFFDRLKDYVKKLSPAKNTEYQFTQREIRLALKSSKSTCFRHFEDLELLEYIQRTGGYANRGFKYKIVFWDDMDKVRTKIKEKLNNELSQLNQPVVNDNPL